MPHRRLSLDPVTAAAIASILAMLALAIYALDHVAADNHAALPVALAGTFV